MRFLSKPAHRGYVPHGVLDKIARLTNDLTGEIRQHTTEERFLPPSIKISPSTKLWLQSINHVATSMYVVRGPSNIQAVYQGVSGANQSITPAGGLAALGGGVTYVILDQNDNVLSTPTILTYGPPGATEQYRIYTGDEFGNVSYIQRFVLKSVTSDVVNNDMVVANFIWSLPNHVANGSIGSISPTWITSSTHSNVLMQIMNVDNIAITPSAGIVNNDTLTFRVGDRNTTVGNDVTVDYRLYTPEGNVSAIERITIPLIVNTPPLLDGFVHNLPDTMLKDQPIAWVWGGGLDIDNDSMVLDVISISGATMSTLIGIAPGISTVLTATGDIGDTIVLNVRLLDRYGVSETRRITSSIIVNPPILDDMVVLVDNTPIESHGVLRPCGVFNLEYGGIIDISGRPVTISVSSPNLGVLFSTSVFDQNTPTIVNIPCGFDPNTQLELNAIISNGISSITRTDLLYISSIIGHELVNVSRIFIKPAGVTSITVIGNGGIGIHTTLTGLVTYTFAGADVTATEYPNPSTILFDNLPGEAGAITVTLAPGTVLNIHWS